MLIQNTRQQLSDEELSGLETRLSIRFPDDFRAFLLKNNGGMPTPNVFDFQDTEGQKSNSLVHYFYAVYDGREYDNLEQNYTFFTDERRIPANLIPIAGDPFGNMVCISVYGDDYGKVYFWDHELEGQNESYDNISLITDSFDEFINSLYEQN